VLAPAEFAFATTVSHLRMALGSTWSPREVLFAAPPPASDAVHRRFFGCPVRFDVAASTIVLDAADLALPMQRPDAELGRVLERHADHLLGALGGTRDFLDDVRRAIVVALPDANATVARTARQLGVSVRTLQRRLQEHGESFDGLYDQTRRALARRYLDDPGVSIQETAHLLAFGDLRGFYRAFKRWEGRTPAEYRRQARAAADGAPRP
jgi:AraC-like DNA-binding protein